MIKNKKKTHQDLGGIGDGADGVGRGGGEQKKKKKGEVGRVGHGSDAFGPATACIPGSPAGGPRGRHTKPAARKQNKTKKVGFFIASRRPFSGAVPVLSAREPDLL